MRFSRRVLPLIRSCRAGPEHGALAAAPPSLNPTHRENLMNQSLPPDVLDQIAQEMLHFNNAPAAFLQAWKRGVQIAGAEWFGDGTRAGMQQAKTKWELRPHVQR